MNAALPGSATRAQRAFAEPQAWRDLLSSDDAAAFSLAWLKLLAATIDQALHPMEPAVLGGFVAMRLGTVQRYTRTATIGDGEASLLLAKVAERCLQVRQPIGQTGGGEGVSSPAAGAEELPAQIAVPIMVGGEMEAVVALELRPLSPLELDRATRFAQWAAAWFTRIIAPRDAAAQRAQADLVVRALGLTSVKGSLASVGQALCTYLADHLDIVRVSLGAAEQAPQRVLATSRGGLATVRTDFMVALMAALDEAVSAGSAVCWPVPQDQVAAIGAHDRLCRLHDADWAVSIPITVERLTFVVCFEGKGPAPELVMIEAWRHLVGLLAPLLELRHAGERDLPTHAVALLRRNVRKWTIGGDRRRWMGLAAFAAVSLGLIFGRGEARMAGHATLEGALRRAIVAPFDGYIQEAAVRPGQRVQAGQTILRLDDRDLVLQQLDSRARIAEAQRQVSDAVGRRDMAQAAISLARRQQSEAELKLVQENLLRARVSAPFDALVISGDMTQQIGAPVRRGDVMYELSPLLRYRIAVEIEEGDFAEIVPGQTGSLVLSALPYETYPITVELVTPIASAKDGRTVFRVDAHLAPGSVEAGHEALRPGMQGVAKINVGERHYVWIWTRTMLSWARLKLWEWLP